MHEWLSARYWYRVAKWKAGFCRRLRRYPPVFVYQMGKVSSRSISEPLKTVYAGEVLHDHVFNRENQQGETRELVAYMNSPRPPEKLYLISLVREPMARNISAFFANYETYTGQAPEHTTCSIEELRALFLDRFPHDQPLTWFEQSVRPHFGIDVYSVPFGEDGAATCAAGRVALLLLRMETDDALKSEKVRAFLGLPAFQVTRANVTGVKAYGDLYRQFKSTARFPAALVNRLCDSPYMRHFYPADFIEKTRERWTER